MDNVSYITVYDIIEQFSNLELIILDVFITYIFRLKFFHYNMFLGRRHPTEQHEILDGIGAKPGGDYQHCGGRHRQALPQSRQVFHGQKMYFLDLISQNPGCIEIQV